MVGMGGVGMKVGMGRVGIGSVGIGGWTEGNVWGKVGIWVGKTVVGVGKGKVAVSDGTWIPVELGLV